MSDAALPTDRRSIAAWGRDLRPAWEGLGAFGLYVALSCLIWLPPIGGAITTRYVGYGWTDARLYQWALAWTPWAILHGHSPLFASDVFSPTGIDISWVTFMPSLGIVAYPLTKAFGTLVSLNVMLLLAPALASWATYLVCHQLTKRFWPAVLGGLFFGFSTFIAGHMVDHLNLVMIFPVPLAVYLVIRRVEASLGVVAFTSLLTLDLVFLFGISTELFATATLFGVIAFALALVFARRDIGIVFRAGLLVALSYALAGLLLLPFLINALQHRPADVLRPVDRTVVDLASWVVPREHTWIGGDRFTSLTAKFPAAPQEDAGYVGIAAILMLIGFAITERRRRGTWPLLGYLAIVAVLASGPILQILGRPTITMPGDLLTKVPLLQQATAQRLPAYGALAIGIIAALWVARGAGRGAWVRWGIAGLAALMVLPAAAPSAFHAFGAAPGFFTSGDVHEQIHQGETVFAITERTGTELAWLAESGFWYQIPEAYLGPVPAAYEGEPLYRGLAVNQRNPYMPTPDEFARWLQDTGTTAVLLDDDAAWKFQFLLESVGLEQVHQGDGVGVWRAGPDGLTPVDQAEVVVNGDPDHVDGVLRRFSFPALGGGPRIEGPDGRPTVFTFVGPDCIDCAAHLTALDAFAQANPEVRAIAVSSWDPEGANTATIDGLNLGYEVAADPLGRLATASFAQPLPFMDQPTPFSILVGGDGQVLGAVDGVWNAASPAAIGL
ncbi:MAG: hypothetical protein ABJB55_01870 [Actinomycetota bacterium]